MAEQSISEHERARQWRKRIGLTRRALSELTGFSLGSIQTFEAGKQGNGDPIDPAAFHRYKMACASVQAGLSFDWGEATFEVTERRRVAI